MPIGGTWVEMVKFPFPVFCVIYSILELSISSLNYLLLLSSQFFI